MHAWIAGREISRDKQQLLLTLFFAAGWGGRTPSDTNGSFSPVSGEGGNLSGMSFSLVFCFLLLRRWSFFCSKLWQLQNPSLIPWFDLLEVGKGRRSATGFFWRKTARGEVDTWHVFGLCVLVFRPTGADKTICSQGEDREVEGTVVAEAESNASPVKEETPEQEKACRQEHQIQLRTPFSPMDWLLPCIQHRPPQIWSLPMLLWSFKDSNKKPA